MLALAPAPSRPPSPSLPRLFSASSRACRVHPHHPSVRRWSSAPAEGGYGPGYAAISAMEAPEPYQRMELERQALLKSPRLKALKNPAEAQDIESNASASASARESQADAEEAALARAQAEKRAAEERRAAAEKQVGGLSWPTHHESLTSQHPLTRSLALSFTHPPPRARAHSLAMRARMHVRTKPPPPARLHVYIYTRAHTHTHRLRMRLKLQLSTLLFVR